MNVLILGSNSLLANAFISINEIENISFWPNESIPRTNILENYNTIFANLSLRSFDVVINCIAKTNLAEQEYDVAETYKINAFFPFLLAQSLSSNQLLVHFSTDQMYQSTNVCGSREVDTKLPLNTYAKAKFISEDCLKIHKKSLVLRTNFVSGNLNNTKHFISWLLSQYEQDRDIPLFEDYICSSIDTYTLCQITHSLIDREATGIVNIGASHGFSKYDLGVSILQSLGLSEANVKKINKLDYEKNLMPQRYNNLTMNCDKLKSICPVDLPDMSRVVYNIVREIKNGKLEN